jgi:hypothetical protein
MNNLLPSGSLINFTFSDCDTLGVILGLSSHLEMYEVLYDNKVGLFFTSQLKIIEGD